MCKLNLLYLVLSICCAFTSSFPNERAPLTYVLYSAQAGAIGQHLCQGMDDP